MTQYINFPRNDSFVNWMRLSLLCEKTGVLAIVEPGTMAGRQAIRQTKIL